MSLPALSSLSTKTRNRLLDAAGVAVLTALVFCSVLGADFVLWDDNTYIFGNARLGGLGLGSLRDILLNVTKSSSWYTPLAGLRFAAIKQFWGLSAGAFHAADWLVHAACAAMLIVFIHELFSSPRAAAVLTKDERWRRVAAVVAGLIWAVHPLRVEVVAWASTSYDLATLFSLGCVLFYARARRRGAGATRELRLALACLGCALLCQPAFAGLVGALFAIDWWSRVSAARRREIWPFMGVTAVLIALNLVVLARSPTGGHVGVGLAGFGVLARLMRACAALVYYAWCPFVPWGASPVHPQFVQFNVLQPSLIAAFILVPAAAYGLFRIRARHAGVVALVFAFAASLLPLLGLTDRLYLPADRYASLSTLTLSVGLAFGLAGARRSRRVAQSAAAFLFVLVVALAVLSMQQSRRWADTKTLLGHTIEQLGDDPYRAFLHWRLARYATIIGETENAKAEYRAGLLLAPEDPIGKNGLHDLCAQVSKSDVEGCVARALH